MFAYPVVVSSVPAPSAAVRFTSVDAGETTGFVNVLIGDGADVFGNSVLADTASTNQLEVGWVWSGKPNLIDAFGLPPVNPGVDASAYANRWLRLEPPVMSAPVES